MNTIIVTLPNGKELVIEKSEGFDNVNVILNISCDSGSAPAPGGEGNTGGNGDTGGGSPVPILGKWSVEVLRNGKPARAKVRKDPRTDADEWHIRVTDSELAYLKSFGKYLENQGYLYQDDEGRWRYAQYAVTSSTDAPNIVYQIEPPSPMTPQGEKTWLYIAGRDSIPDLAPLKQYGKAYPILRSGWVLKRDVKKNG